MKGAVGSGRWSLEPGRRRARLMAGRTPRALNTAKKMALRLVGSAMALVRRALSGLVGEYVSKSPGEKTETSVGRGTRGDAMR
jgi:hypothetical protein